MIAFPEDNRSSNSNKMSGEITVKDAITQGSSQHVMTVEIPCVERVRGFFDYKAKEFNFKKDKMSQAYIVKNFAESELHEYIFQNFPEDKLDDYQLNLCDLKIMFQAYCQEPDFSPSLECPKKIWEFSSAKKRQELLFWLKNTPKSVFLSYAWKNFLSFSFIGTAGVFIWNSPVREQQKYFQAWQVINTAQNQSGTGGRNEALKYLNGGETIPLLNWAAPQCKKNNTCLVGIKIVGGKGGGEKGKKEEKEEANLNDVNLENANLTASTLKGVSFRRANLRFADFKDADLKGAVFKDADLAGADFRYAKNKSLADFTDAKFCNTKWSVKGEAQRPDCHNFFHWEKPAP